MRRILAALAFSAFLLAAPVWPEPIRITGWIEPPGIAGGRIELRAYPREGQAAHPPVTARPAADGSFELTAPEPGLYRLSVLAEGYTPSGLPALPVLEETELPILGLQAVEVRRLTSLPAKIWKGRVLDSVTRAPEQGALVWQAGLAFTEDVPWTWTAADGSFRLALHGPDPMIGAAAAGHVPIPRYSLSSGNPLVLELLPAITLAGQIVDPEDKPVAGASVNVDQKYLSGEPEPKEARSSADGRFRLHGLTPETAYQLIVRAEGFVTSWQKGVLGRPGRDVPPLRIVLSPGVILTGRIVDSGGKPIAGADLDFSSAADGLEWAGLGLRIKASSEATGFRFEHVGKGAYSLQVLLPGFAPFSRSGTVGTPPRGVLDLGDLALEPGAAIEGLVTDLRGMPIEGAQVVLPDSGRLRMFARREEPVLTGADGSFRFADLEGSRRFDLSVHKPGYVPASVPGVEAPTKEPLRIELRPARSLSGRVLDSERRPVAGARVAQIELQETGFGNNGSFDRSARGVRGVGRTDQEGRFVLSELEPGPLHLEVAARGFRTTELSGLRIPEEGEADPVEVVLERGAVLEGRVLDGKGQPAGNARVEVSGSQSPFGLSCLTDDQGNYRIDGLDPGEHRVTATLESGRSIERKVVLGDFGTHRLDLRAPSGVEVSGRVVDEQGKPLQGVEVFLLPLAGRLIQSAADGAFWFQDVPDGNYQLLGRAPGYIAPAVPDEVLVAGQEISSLVLRLVRGGTITGRILGIDDGDLGMPHVEARREEAREWVSATAHDKTYQLTVAPGTWRVTASLSSGLAATGTVSVAAGEEAVLDLEMPRGLTLSGHVLLDGQPLAGAAVQVTGSPGPESGQAAGATTRYDGSFSIPGLRPGRVILAVVSRGIYHPLHLDLTTDQAITIEISTGQVSGHVLSSTGEPVEGALVALRGEDEETGGWSEIAQLSTDERGAFEFLRLAAGSYRITVTGDGFTPASQTVVVTPGGTTQIQVVLEPQ